jgi:hypothetical protein
MRLKLPKVNFIFYEYFFKAVVADGLWKDALVKLKGWVPMSRKPLLMRSSKTTTSHGWLYDYKNKNPGCTLLTEYNLVEQDNEDSNDDDDKWIFCSDLDEIEIALPIDDGGDYELVFNEGPTKEQAKAAADEVRKDALSNVSN